MTATERKPTGPAATIITAVLLAPLWGATLGWGWRAFRWATGW